MSKLYLLLHYYLIVIVIVKIKCIEMDEIVLIEDFIVTKHTKIGFILTCTLSKKDDVKLAKYLSNIAQITTIKSSVDYDAIVKIKHHVFITVIRDCHQKLNTLLSQCGNLKIFDAKKHWLIILPQNRDLKTIFENVHFNIDSDVNVAISTNDNVINIYDVYNQAFKQNGALHVRMIGNYSKNDRDFPKIREAKYWRRKNMTGVVFKTAVVMPVQMTMTRHQYLNTDEFRSTRSFDRFHYNMIKHCRDFYNFTMKVDTVESWGYLQPDGTINGMVNLLNNTIIDFGGSPLFYKYERLNLIDYSVSTWILRSTFIYRRPKINAPPMEVFVRPLSLTVWLCVLATVIFISIAIKFILKYEKLNVCDNEETNWVFVTVWSIGIMCQQGSFHVPFLNSGRIVLLIFLVFTILLYQFYSGYILAYVLMDPPRTIHNLQDLLASSLRAGCEDVLFDHDYFAITTDPVAKELYKRKIRNDSGFFMAPDGLKIVSAGGFAFHVETSTAYPIIIKTFSPEAICELEEVQMYRTQIMYMNLQKWSPFKQMFDHCIRRLHENGNIFRMRRYWDSPKPVCIKESNKITAVGLQEFSFALILLFFGIIFSLLLLTIEILFNKQVLKRKALFKPYVN